MDLKEFKESCIFPIFKETFSIKHKCGEGANSEVYAVNYQGNCYAMKSYKQDDWEDPYEFYQELYDELQMYDYMSSLRQSVQVRGIGFRGHESMDDFEVLLFMDLLDKDLYDYIQKKSFWTSSKEKVKDKVYQVWNQDDKLWWSYHMKESEKISIMKSSLNALEEIHRKMIVHCDCKTHNMVWDNKQQKIILIDFGSSEYLDNKEYIVNEGSGTPGYMAPEQKEGIVNYYSDIYSWGVSMIELWNGDIWDNDNDNEKQCRNQVLYSLRKIESENKCLGNLFRKCISIDYQKRPSIQFIKSMINDL